MRRGVPGAGVDAAEHGQQPQRVHAPDPGHAVLAVGREHVVLGDAGHGPSRSAPPPGRAARPQTQLALPLQGDRLGVDPAGQHHVAVEAPDLLVVPGRSAYSRVVDPLTLGGQQLDRARYVRARATGCHRSLTASSRPAAASAAWRPHTGSPYGGSVAPRRRLCAGERCLRRGAANVPPACRRRENNLHVLILCPTLAGSPGVDGELSERRRSGRVHHGLRVARQPTPCYQELNSPMSDPLTRYAVRSHSR